MVEILEGDMAGYQLDYSALDLKLWEQIWCSNMIYKRLTSPKSNVKIGWYPHHSAMCAPL